MRAGVIHKGNAGADAPSEQRTLFDEAAREKLCTGEDRRQEPSQISVFHHGDQARNSRFTTRAVASSKKRGNTHLLSKMTKGSAASPESNAAYYSKWGGAIVLQHFRFRV